MHVQKYIEMLDQKIDKLIRKETEGLTDAERDLHILFENRKHAKRWKEEMNSMTDEHMDNPRKSYFGGM